MVTLNLLLSTSLLTLILLIQLLHYPSFTYYDTSTFSEAMRFHQRRISWIVMPLMLAEALVATVLVIRRGDAYCWASLGIVVAIWVVTFTGHELVFGSLRR